MSLVWGTAGALELKRNWARGCGTLLNSSKIIKTNKKILYSVYLEWLLLGARQSRSWENDAGSLQGFAFTSGDPGEEETAWECCVLG